MLHGRDIAADRLRRNAAAQSRMRLDLSERRMAKQFDELDAPAAFGEPISARACILALQQARIHNAQAVPDRHEQNALRGSALREGTLQLRHLAQIDARLGDEPSLEDEGRACLDRASMLRNNAFALNRIQHDATDPTRKMTVRRDAQSSLAGAIAQEVRGVAALEGRAGIAARTGLADDKLDAFVEKSGIGPIVERHTAEKASALPADRHDTVPMPVDDPTPALEVSASPDRVEPAEYWLDLERRLEPDTFDLAVCRFRSEQIRDLYGAPDASAETRATYNAMRKMHSDAQEAGPTSGKALRVNQKLVADLPEGSDARKAMIVIRGIALDQRRHAQSDKNSLRD